jgi:acyl-CoA reductase-like NAD-dependent aldehyde dehydrogenase
MPVIARHWIAGQWVESADGSVATSNNPSSGACLGSFADGKAADATIAINAARICFEESAWAHQPRVRAQVLLDFADQLEAAKSDLAVALARENGKLLGEAGHEIVGAISECRYYAGLARNIFGRVTEVDQGQFSMLAREPMGVAGIIVPWNAPITLLIRSLAPAIAAGCTSVTKVAPETALVNAMVFELLADVEGIPPGAINMLAETGSEVAKLLVDSQEVDVISYTGSTQVGKLIMAAAASTLKRVNLELGGSAPCVVFADADLDQAVAGITRAAMAHAGQVCVAASRVMAEQSIAVKLQNRLTDSLTRLKLGAADSSNSQLGPLIDDRSVERMTGLIDASRDVGELLLAGQRVGGELAQGSFVSPSLVRVADSGSEFLQQEIFGPMLTVDTFNDEDDAVEKANNSRFGLAASVWTADLQRGMRLASRIKSGTVWLNAHLKLHAETETGGYRESGLGRLHGVEGLNEFLQTKHISWQT